MSLKICRGCLIESNELKNIFSLKIEIDYVHNLNFSDCFKICTDIFIEKSDKLPQKICDECIESLVAAYKYRTQCKKSDLKLKSKITKNVVTVKEEETFLSGNEESDHHIDSTCEFLNSPVEENYEEENVMIIEKLNEVEEELYEEEFDEHFILTATETFELESSNISTQEPLLEIHQDIEHPIKTEFTSETNNRYVCKICGLGMEKRHKFLYHMRRHRETHSCTICPKKFIRKEQLQEHYKNGNHLNKKIKCKVCAEEIGENGLTDHMHIHSNEKPFQCDICNKTFRFKSAVNSHMWTHKEFHELPFECNICPKRFGFKTLLRDHLRIVHNQERAYQCDLCPKNYLRSSALYAHRRSWHGNNKFECEICKKLFSTKSTLKKHSYIHTGHLFACPGPECQYSCSRQHRMKQHVLKHHKREWEPNEENNANEREILEYENIDYLDEN